MYVFRAGVKKKLNDNVLQCPIRCRYGDKCLRFYDLKSNDIHIFYEL